MSDDEKTRQRKVNAAQTLHEASVIADIYDRGSDLSERLQKLAEKIVSDG